MAKIIEKKDLRNRDQVFNDRAHAGRILAAMLMPYRETFSNSIVLAIPSGGVPVGKVISETLDMPFDLVIVRKIPIPYNTEAGFGSVSWDGEVELNNKLLSRLQLSDSEIESAVAEVRRELKRRMERFRGSKPFPVLKGRTVIAADDGLASGYTMLSAAGSIKKYSPARIIIAVPTASISAVELLSPHVDEIFCPNIKETMHFAVADAYQEWHDLSEQEVIRILER